MTGHLSVCIRDGEKWVALVIINHSSLPPFVSLSSVKKQDAETGAAKKKEVKRKRESPENSDAEKTPPASPEDDDDLGVQVKIVHHSRRGEYAGATDLG